MAFAARKINIKTTFIKVSKLLGKKKICLFKNINFKLYKKRNEKGT